MTPRLDSSDGDGDGYADDDGEDGGRGELLANPLVMLLLMMLGGLLLVIVVAALVLR